MIKEIKIDSLDGVMELLCDQSRNTTINRLRSPYFFRGISNEKYPLLTTLYRNCNKESTKLEMPLLNSFIKYAKIEYPSMGNSIWEAMAIGQHHGLPTRLMDWTRSPMIALQFADSESALDELGKHNCVVWRIDANEINDLLPAKYSVYLKHLHTVAFTDKNLYDVVKTIDEYDGDMDGNAFVLLEPSSVDQRIVNQFSFFAIIPDGIVNLELFLDGHTNNTVKYIIDKSIRWDIRDLLDQQNMNERMMYPGLDGITKWLARRYYVR